MIMSNVAVTIGNFDGVHQGHAALVRRARELVGATGRVVALAFDPHPATRLRAGSAPARLTTFEHRSALLLQCGADEVHRLEPDDSTLLAEPEQFIARVVESHRPAWFVEGEDFHFGKNRTGTPRTLQVLGKAWGFGVDIVPAVEVALVDQLIARASSSLVRWLLLHGRVRDAATVLGRHHELSGEVVQGDQRGRTMGFPTANLVSQCLAPADGVYAALATLPDGAVAPAAVNIGKRPTFAGHDRRIEAHLIGARIDGHHYGWPLRLAFVAWVRDQIRFDSVERLRAQLARDVVAASRLAS